MFTCDLYAGSPPPHDLERLRTTMQRRVVDFVRVGYFIPLNGPLNGYPPSLYYYRLKSVIYESLNSYIIWTAIQACIIDMQFLTWLCNKHVETVYVIIVAC